MNNAHEGDRLITFLPEDSGEVNSPQRRGVWQPISELIKKLSRGLKVPEEASPDTLTAIPTIWARPILFAQALTDNNHPLHTPIEREWRGLLGLFCFKDAYGWRINSKRYTIRTQSEKTFERALYILKPSEDWLTIHLIYVENVLIGATSPLSLFFTPSEYKCPDSIEWKEKGRLDDPIKYLDPQGFELDVLRKWITNTRESIAKYKFGREETKENILRVLKNWSDSINSSQSLEDVTFQKPIIDENPYQLASYVSSYEQPKRSDFFLKCKIKERPPIVVVKELWERGGIIYPPFNTSTVPFNTIPNKLEGKAKEICDAIKYGGTYLRPDYLFTDRILKLSFFEKNVFTNHKDYAFPLHAGILKFFESKDLVKLVSWDDVDKGIRVTLRLPLETGTKEERFIEVSKFYDDDKIIKLDLNPVLELWPDFQADDWKYYYCLYQYKYKRSNQEDYQYNPFSCEPYPKTGRVDAHGDTLVWKMEEFPTAIIFKDSSENPIGLIPTREPRRLEKLVRSDSNWTVSVDFGTSNTSVFYRRNINALPEKLVFHNRCLQLTYPEAEETRKLVLFSSLFPPIDIEGIFPSNLCVFNPSSNPEPMIDGVILFVDPIQWMDIFTGVEVHENLKWSIDESERSHIATFLKQVLLSIMTEARCCGVNKISLRYSYPSSFSTKMKNDLTNFWSAIVGIGTSTGFEIGLSHPEMESACICKYLVRERGSTAAAPDRPQVVVDVGGGTADVAIWMENKLQIQTSLLLAGNILSSYAHKEKKFRENILAAIGGVTLNDKLFIDHTPAVMNILLQLYNERIKTAIDTTLKHVHEIRRARTIVFLLSSGIFYYIGMLLRNLACNGKEIHGCDIYLAGNGVRLFDWVSDKTNYTSLISIFKSGLNSSVTAHVDLKDAAIRINPVIDAKEEVARGLVHDYPLGSAAQQAVMIIGEQGYENNGEKLSWDFDISNHFSVLKSLSVPDKFPELEALISSFNSQADSLSLETISFDSSRVRAQVQQKVKEYEIQEEKVLLQPFFIEEVRALLADLIEGKLKGR